MELIDRILFSVCVAFTLAPANTHAQAWQWAQRGQGGQYAYGYAVDVDAAGNSVVTGAYKGSIEIGGQTLSTPGEDGILLAKFAPDGTPLWSHIGANGSAIAAHGVSVDDEGRIAIVGIYQDTVVFIPGGLGYPLISAGAFDVFVAMYDADGSPLWARSLGDVGFDYGTGISHDAQGNVYVCGEFHQTAFNQSASKVFVAKFDVDGNPQWTTQSAAYGTSHLGDAIHTDPAGNSCITGEFFNAITLGSFVLTNPTPEAGIYVAKLDPDGTPLWAQMAGVGGYGAGEGVGMDADGNAYITGFYRGTMAFGSITLPGPGEMAYDVFVAKCSSADGTFLWAGSANAPGTSDIGWGISVDDSGNNYVVGSFAGALTVGGTTLQPIGGADMFVAKFSSNGQPLWATRGGGPLSETIGGIKVQGDQVFVTGGFESAMAFGQGVSLTGQSAVYDLFVAKLLDVDISGIGEEGTSVASRVYPDPVMDMLQVSGLRNACRYAIVDDRGRVVGQGELTGEGSIEVSDLAQGHYVLRLVTSDLARPAAELPFVK